MVIVSEVVKRGKRAEQGRKHDLLALLFLFPLALLLAAPASLGAEEPPSSLDRLGDCNWVVKYRGRTYDLTPLTREALTRPIENDIRYALQRVPGAAEHLENMTGQLQASRTYTILASVFLAGFVTTALLKSGAKTSAERKNYTIAMAGTGASALTSTFLSWRSSRKAKQELVDAVREFNAHSPHPIEPAVQGDLND